MGAAITKQSSAALAQISGYSEDQIDLIKRTIAEGATDDELQLFLHVAKRMQLDPFAKQVYAVKRWDSQRNCNVMSIQVGIDGFRLTADRTGKYAGQVGPQWCGEDGVWKDVWLGKVAPSAARVGVLRTDFKEPLWAVARFDAYAQTKKDGSLTMMWATKGDIMIAKCAESLALRKAFPAELSGVYTSDEMAQADNPEPVKLVPQAVREQRKEASGVVDMPTESDPADFVLTITKNAGKRLGDLTDAQIAWYADDCKDHIVNAKAQAVREQRHRERELAELARADAAEKDINKDWGLAPDDVGREDREADDPAHEHSA